MGRLLVDLADGYRGISGTKIEGNTLFDIDGDGVQHTVGDAVAAAIRNNLRNGRTPDGLPMPRNKKGEPRGTGGSGKLADSIRYDSATKTVTIGAGDRAAAARRVFEGVDIAPQGLVEQPDVIDALNRAAAACIGGEK